MQKLLAAVASLLFVVSFATPAQSEGAKYSVYQKTLATFSPTATALTAQQKAQVKAAVDANPTAEKFICTGIRYYSQPMSVNIMVRKRAKAACEYAKQLNPELSTWYQNKPTKARSYAGKVLLTVKTQLILPTSEEGNGDESDQQISTNPRESVEAGVSKDPEICKLRETSSYRSTSKNALASSFPAAEGMTVSRTGTINVKVVFIEWDDLRGTQDDYDYNLWSAKTFSDFYRVMSEGKLNLRVTAEPDWISVGDSWAADVIPAGMEGGSWQSREFLRPFIDQIIQSVDPQVDFTDVDVILFGTPSAEIVVDSLHIFGATEVPAYTNEGTIHEMFSLGRRIYEHKDSQPGWAQYAHEFGHALGIPDLRNSTRGQGIGIPMYFVSPMYGHEIMDNQNSGSRSISGWIKWVQGWLNDSQVTCIDSANVVKESYELDSANIVGAENELLTIRVSDTKLIAVESTRWDSKFDLRTNQKTNGVIVYTVDSSVGHQEGPLRLVSPRDITTYLRDDHIWPDWRVLDVILFEGDEVEIEGIKITNFKSEANTDIVIVETTG